ncbi:MAG: zinc protease [Sphingobacteriales bacterium]|jgi:zinc protease
MKLRLLTIVATVAILISACTDKKSSSRKYQSVKNDPTEARIYTLDNGLKVYLSVNKDEPRVQTLVAVKAGSKQDPADATGLAHYLEHMLFKGTSELATTNWEEEKAILQQISDLYEARRNTTDEGERTTIYQQIDSLSFIAAKFAIPNEYDKVVSGMGAKGTNAFTSFEQTVYINDIPSNEIQKWAELESLRFQDLVLRLFHTELETVYEEFNRGQDSDGRKMIFKMFEKMFKNHPYGTQSTIGTADHLKNPSMEKIHEYFVKNYIPNNMAIIMSGDIDPDKTIEIINETFGKWEKKETPVFTFTPEEPITGIIEGEVLGPQAENLMIGYRFGGGNTQDPIYLTVIDALLNNGQAGLIDLNLINQQKVLRANSFVYELKDYTGFFLSGYPRQGQSLDEVKDLLLEQIELIKTGNFDDYLLDAIIKDFRLSQMRTLESNQGRAFNMLDAFIMERDWEDQAQLLEKLKGITKEKLVEFANKNFKDNYIYVKKLTGNDPSIVRIQKPSITPLEINREDESVLYKRLDSIESGRITPLFVDYKSAINTASLENGLSFSSIENKTNEIFNLYYLFDMGTDNDKQLSIALDYLTYLGTDKYTSDELKKEFFKLGLSFDVFSSRDKVYIYLTGLQESFEEGVKLFEHILANVKVDETAFVNLSQDELKDRADTRLNKGSILFGAMNDYAKYGPKSPFTNKVSNKNIVEINPQDLVDKIKDLSNFKHRIFYYGPAKTSVVESVLEEHHMVSEELKDYPAAQKFETLATVSNKVYFVDYDMVQVEMMQISRSKMFDAKNIPLASIFGEYFGSGLSSIIFQEIREAKALAYSAYSGYSTPSSKDEYHYVTTYIGTQADKLVEATKAMNFLMNNMPETQEQFNAAKSAALKKIETDRITKTSIFFSYEAAKKIGFDYDYRKDVYDAIEKMTMADLKVFFDANIAGSTYSKLVIGKKKDMNMKVLKDMGAMQELTLDEIFNYY